MKKLILGFLMAAACSMATPAMAQQQAADPAFLQKGINVLITQRNNALNAQVEAEARLSQVMDDNLKLKAELDELKKKLPADK